jgi:hypothetical protein
LRVIARVVVVVVVVFVDVGRRAATRVAVKLDMVAMV